MRLSQIDSELNRAPARADATIFSDPLGRDGGQPQVFCAMSDGSQQSFAAYAQALRSPPRRISLKDARSPDVSRSCYRPLRVHRARPYIVAHVREGHPEQRAFSPRDRRGLGRARVAFIISTALEFCAQPRAIGHWARPSHGQARRCGLLAAVLTRTELRELLAGNVFPNHSYALEYRRDRSALLLVLFRLWFFLLAIASQLALCHLVLPSLALDAAFCLPRIPPPYM